MTVFTIWEGDNCGLCLKLGDSPPTLGMRGPPDETAVKVKEFEAASWNEACQVKYDHYGWGRYRTPEEDGLAGWEEIKPGRN